MSAWDGESLPGSSRDLRPLRYCWKCDTDKVQSGGVDTPRGFTCGNCWRRRMFSLAGIKSSVVQRERKKAEA